MPTLSDEIKTFIVMSLARYDTPSAVAQAVKTTFDIEISRQQVYSYDPACSKPPTARWQELHAATRQAFLREMAEIGIAQKARRLKMLDQMANHALDREWIKTTAIVLEQAAKECGGFYDRRTHAVPAVPAGAESVAPAAPALAAPPTD